MDRKNRTYTLLEDSESDGDAGRTEEHRGKKKSKHKDKATKRKHIRQKKASDSSSEDEPPKRYFTYFYRPLFHLHRNPSINLIFYISFLLHSVFAGVCFSLFHLSWDKGRAHHGQVANSFK